MCLQFLVVFILLGVGHFLASDFCGHFSSHPYLTAMLEFLSFLLQTIQYHFFPDSMRCPHIFGAALKHRYNLTTVLVLFLVFFFCYLPHSSSMWRYTPYRGIDQAHLGLCIPSWTAPVFPVVFSTFRRASHLSSLKQSADTCRQFEKIKTKTKATNSEKPQLEYIGLRKLTRTRISFSILGNCAPRKT